MTVHLVGAGPGDPGLLTVRGAELLAGAEVVVHDRLVDERVLALAAGARLVDVGKRAGDRASDQDSINSLLVDLGRRHRSVVRLKGGDPFVLGRGGEEVLALARAGLAVEVVPGVTSAVAVPAYAGVPVTHRGISSGFAVVTGHDAGSSAPAVDWPALARSGLTLVVLMGAATLGDVAARLLAGGRAADAPVLVVERGTTPGQRARRTTLAGLRSLEAESPATVVVGEVAALELAPFEARPLAGWRVVVTRPAAQTASLAVPLAAAGAMPVELPVIDLAPPPDGGVGLRDAAARLAEFDWVVLTSANGVDRLLAEVRDARSFGAARVAAIGDATAAALARHGIVADLVPPRHVGEALVEAFASAGPLAGSRVLVARSAVARDVVPEGLVALGCSVEVVDAYVTVAASPGAAQLEAARAADAVTFTSPSTVAAYLGLVGDGRVPPVVATIGPVTSAAARAAGLAVDVEATVHTAAGLADALAAFARDRRASPRGARSSGGAEPPDAAAGHR